MVVPGRISAALAAFAFIVLTGLAAAPAADAAQLVVVGSAHCPYCLAWEREIGHSYSRTAEGQMAPIRRLNIETPRPADLAKLKPVNVTPTFVLVDEGREVGRIVGYSGDRVFWPQLHRLLAKLHARNRSAQAD